MDEDYGEGNEINYSESSEATEQNKDNTIWIILAVILVILCCCCLVVAGGVYYVLNWFWVNGDQIFGLGLDLTYPLI